MRLLIIVVTLLAAARVHALTIERCGVLWCSKHEVDPVEYLLQLAIEGAVWILAAAAAVACFVFMFKLAVAVLVLAAVGAVAPFAIPLIIVLGPCYALGYALARI